MSPERSRDPRSRGDERRGPINSYPPGVFAPLPGALARRDTFPRFSGVPPPAPSIPSIHWP